MRNLPHSLRISENIQELYTHASLFSKGIFLLAGLSLLFLTGYLLYSVYPVMAEMLSQALSADYSTSLVQSGW